MFDEKELEYLREMESRIVDQATANMRVLIESCIDPKFEMLAEGHKSILDAAAPKSRVEALEDEVAFMKQVIRNMTRDIAELKKAQ